MLPPFDYFQYLQARNQKRQERYIRFASLNPEYSTPLSVADKSIIDKQIQELVWDVHKGVLSGLDILHTYGKIAIKAQQKTNCITELLLPEAEKWFTSGINLGGPLAGVPVSLKDTINVKGFDSTIGYARFAGKPLEEDGPMVRLLKDAGAIPYCKTALPVTLLSFESANGLWGACRNPHVPEYSPGGSSGGEGALLALGGRIGIGSDVAGSVRLPSAWSGVYTIRCSTGRWPKVGTTTSLVGQEGIPSVYSPMARTLNDLTYFSRAIIGMKPWEYDHTVHPIPWRADLETKAKEERLRVGVMRSDGVVPPTPAIARAINTTIAALTVAGHTVVDVNPPSTADPFTGFNLASQLLNSDGCSTFSNHFYSFEPNDPGAAQLSRVANLPWPVRYLYYLYIRYIKRDSKWATLIREFTPKSSAETWKLVARRETFRATWHAWWDAEPQKYDFILCPVNSTPALPHNAMRDAVSACGYTFLFNLLDYSAGVVPVSHVDPAKDSLPKAGKNAYRKVLKELGYDNAIAQGAWMHYDAAKMAGLPTAVQIVGRRLEEERVLGFMANVEAALEAYKDENGEGGKYTLLAVD